MMNILGKTLVFANLLLSVAFLAWAAAIYLHAVDWGFMEPRKLSGDSKEGGVRVPSEIDKRTAAVKQAAANKSRSLAGVRQAQARVADVDTKFADNHLWYEAKLQELAKAPGVLQIKQLKYTKDNTLERAGGQPAGLPVLEKQPVPGLTKSLAESRKDLAKILNDVEKEQKTIEDWQSQELAVSAQLNGKKDAQGKVLERGYYHLLERERNELERLKAEIDYMEPLWVRELVKAQMLSERRRSLERRLRELGEPAVGTMNDER